MQKILPLSILLMIAVASCRQTENVTCDTGSYSFIGIGYSVADFNGATISQYKAGTNYSNLLQNGNISYNLWVRGTITSDSGSITPPASMAVAHDPEEITTTCDYILSIPALSISDTLSDAVFLGPVHKEMTSSDAHPAICINQIGSYQFNSQSITPSAVGFSYNLIYLVR